MTGLPQNQPDAAAATYRDGPAPEPVQPSLVTAGTPNVEPGVSHEKKKLATLVSSALLPVTLVPLVLTPLPQLVSYGS